MDVKFDTFYFIFYMCVLERMKDVLSVCDVKEEIIG